MLSRTIANMSMLNELHVHVHANVLNFFLSAYLPDLPSLVDSEEKSGKAAFSEAIM